MAQRYLEVTVRIDFGPDLTTEDREEIKDSVVSDIQFSATNNGFETDFEVKDIQFFSKWEAK
jgi:hypothetical protein